MSTTLASSKVIVQEEPPALRLVAGAPTSIAGAVGVAQRGPVGQAVRCVRFDDFQQRFGGYTADAELSLAVQGFFDNGGSELWVVRTVHYTDPADATTMTARRAGGVLRAASVTTPNAPADVDWLRVEGKDPGGYANRIEVEIQKSKSRAADAFDLAVIEDGRYREVFADVRFARDSNRHVVKVINATRGGSALIRLVDLETATGVMAVPQTIALTGGVDGLSGLNDADFVGTSTGRNGLHAFDRVQDLPILFVPGRATPVVHERLLEYCELDRGGASFAVLDPPSGASAEEMVTYVEETAQLLESSEYGAIYWPRVTVPNPARSVFGDIDSVVAPPSGAIAGVYARTDASRPGGVYVPPAGIDNGRLFGVNGFETDEVLDESKRDIVYPKLINPLTTGTGLPRFIDGTRTLKSTGNFPSVSERRGVSFIETSARRALQSARHRNNDESLVAEVGRSLTSFLGTQMDVGAFRSRVAETAFFVDMSRNTPDVLFAKKLIARIGLATQKPNEFVILSVSADTRDIEAALAAASA
jgi:phage tail sheath protein FI